MKHHHKYKAPIPIIVWVKLSHKHHKRHHWWNFTHHLCLYKDKNMTPVTVGWVTVDTVFPDAENVSHFVVTLNDANGPVQSMNVALDIRTASFVPGLDAGDYTANVQLTDTAGTADFGHVSTPFTIPSAPPPVSAPIPSTVSVVLG